MNAVVAQLIMDLERAADFDRKVRRGTHAAIYEQAAKLMHQLYDQMVAARVKLQDVQAHAGWQSMVVEAAQALVDTEYERGHQHEPNMGHLFALEKALKQMKDNDKPASEEP